MGAGTNNKTTNRRRHDDRRRETGSNDPSPAEARYRKRQPGFWEAVVDRQSLTHKQPQGNDTAPLSQALPNPSSTPLATPTVDDVCPVSKSIEAVFVSKTEARKQQAILRTRNIRYQDETRRPIVCLLFVLPLLVLYELGSILLGHQSLRSGIDQWFHQPLYQLGFGGLVVLPIVTIAVLVFWHHQKQDHWQIRPAYLGGMFIEAFGLGLILFWAANAISQIADGSSVAAAAPAVVSQNAWCANIVACVGSGIYEELIFRIGMLSLLIFWASKLIPGRKSAAVTGVVAVSLLFAALHYSVFNPAGNPFELSSFMFRFFASIVFCILFLFRGFGIAVGAHVAYDVLTQV